MANIYKSDKQTDDALFSYNQGSDVITITDIKNQLEISAINHGYENLSDIENNCSSSKFNILLRDIGSMFKDTRSLIISKTDNNIYNNINNNMTWEYDKYKVLSLVPVYASICQEYNKRISESGFLYFCGIDINYFNRPSKTPILSENLRAKIAENLRILDGEQQKDRARDSNQAILQLAYNNYVHGWSGEIKRTETTNIIKSLEDIKKERIEMSADEIQNDF